MNISELEGRVLGKTITYPQEYSPDILVAIPRKWNREIYELDDDELPFVGVDAWHAYELSFLTEKGLPVAGLLKIVVDAKSACIVESKSLKLYLNSYNMSRFGATKPEGIVLVKECIAADLSTLINSEVQVQYFEGKTLGAPLFEDFDNLDNRPELEMMSFDTFNETPDLLQVATENNAVKWTSELLRSNCKVTNQPDWGTVYVSMAGEQMPEALSFIEYLVSVRNENHFHEEICEMIFKRLYDRFTPDSLMVACIYTRRGGIDICPIRAMHVSDIPEAFTNVDILMQKTLRQ